MIDHFLSGYSRILQDAELKASISNGEEIPSIDVVKITEDPGAEGSFNFNADFKLKNYKVAFLGTTNKNQVITNEVMSGKRSIRQDTIHSRTFVFPDHPCRNSTPHQTPTFPM
ncbi:hypothetical protein BH10BAC4_BH10BAC4_23780 [soil metagenome]